MDEQALSLSMLHAAATRYGAPPLLAKTTAANGVAAGATSFEAEVSEVYDQHESPHRRHPRVECPMRTRFAGI